MLVLFDSLCNRTAPELIRLDSGYRSGTNSELEIRIPRIPYSFGINNKNQAKANCARFLPSLITPELSATDWRVLEFLYRNRTLTSSLQIGIELNIEHKKVLDSLSDLHYHGFVYFRGIAITGTNENIVAKITEKGIDALVFRLYNL